MIGGGALYLAPPGDPIPSVPKPNLTFSTAALLPSEIL